MAASILNDQTVVRTETSCAIEIRERFAGVSAPDPYPATNIPSGGEVWIERNRLIDQRHAAAQISSENRDCMGGPARNVGVVLTQFCCAPRQLSALGRLSRWVYEQAERLALDMAVRHHRIGQRELRLDSECQLVLRERCINGSGRPFVEAARASHYPRIGIKLARQCASVNVDFGLLEFRHDLTDDTLGQLVLKLESIRQFALEPSSPKIAPVRESMSWALIRMRVPCLRKVPSRA